jgi:hypothetical protein
MLLTFGRVNFLLPFHGCGYRICNLLKDQEIELVSIGRYLAQSGHTEIENMIKQLRREMKKESNREFEDIISRNRYLFGLKKELQAAMTRLPRDQRDFLERTVLELEIYGNKT